MTLVLLFLCFNINAQESDLFVGLWRCRTPDPSTDMYISINKIAEKEYFIIYVNPFWYHDFDYAEQGKLTEDGYVKINNGKRNYYLNFSKFGRLVQFIGSFNDPHPLLFSRVTNNKMDLNKIRTVDEFLEYIKSNNTDL